jgi:hypothetical protein
MEAIAQGFSLVVFVPFALARVISGGNLLFRREKSKFYSDSGPAIHRHLYLKSVPRSPDPVQRGSAPGSIDQSPERRGLRRVRLPDVVLESTPVTPDAQEPESRGSCPGKELLGSIRFELLLPEA